ncbi:GIY-YIG nuclease family protein [Ruminococcus sp. YE282]|uniref:GIY-YIG nuclease family protein n=1 Tax=Ruminococcus sp. YE282 TaxID=3158780 RepID=UPI000880E178|nr:GIY-YIG catalytic domain-containing protein [Ruminococcus bromii]
MHYLYFYINHAGTIIYIGETNDIQRRNNDHLKKEYWADEIAGIYIAKIATQYLAEIYEGFLIDKYNPIHNEQHPSKWLSYYGNCEDETSKINYIFIAKDILQKFRPMNTYGFLESLYYQDKKTYLLVAKELL